jgi:hypothetical protein
MKVHVGGEGTDKTEVTNRHQIWEDFGMDAQERISAIIFFKLLNKTGRRRG